MPAASPADLAPEPGAARDARVLLAAGLAVWLLLSLLSLLRHHTFHSSLYDLGIFHQVLWNTAHGRPFASSVKHMSYLGDHFSPTFGLLAPVALLPRAVDVLLLLQAACVPLVAREVHRLARRHLPPRTALLVALATMLCPPLYCPTLADLHPEPFMALCIAAALERLDRGATLSASLLLALAAGGKEDAGLLLAPLGAVLALRGPTRRFGLVLAVASLLWMALAMTVLMPALRPPARPGAAWFYLGRFAHLGESPAAIARTVLVHPLHALAVSTTARKLVTLATLLLPLCAAPVLSLRLLAVLPFAAAHYLSSRPTEFYFPFHYLVPAVPVLAWAAIEGAPASMMRLPRLAAGLAVAFGLLAVVWRFDPEPLGRRDNHDALRDAVRVVPPDEPVCVQNHVGAHLSGRREVDFCVLWEWEREQYAYYGWSHNSSARWQVFDRRDGVREHPALELRLAALRAAGAEVVFERDGVVVLDVAEPVLARVAPVETPPTSPEFHR